MTSLFFWLLQEKVNEKGLEEEVKVESILINDLRPTRYV
jgi:hypothetical protein